jgi:RHS repeat-associated protein
MKNTLITWSCLDLDYNPFGMLMVGRNWTAGSEYAYGFNGKKNDKEIYGESNVYDYGFRNYDARLGKWFSIDPAFSITPYESTYIYVGNNPIYYIDQRGLWKVRYADNNNHSKGIVLEAEKGDNLETLATQMGIPYQQLLDQNFNGKDWSTGLELEGKWLRAEDLPGVIAFAEINKYLAREDVNQTNCSNCAMAINGFTQDNAWPLGDIGGGPSVNAMTDADNKINNQFSNIPEYQAKFGDVITYKGSMKSAEQNGDWMDYVEFLGLEEGTIEYEDFMENHVNNSPTAHYSIVLLKTSDGQKVEQVFEKPGQSEPRISIYIFNDDSEFIPAPANGNNTASGSPVYSKN